MLCEESYRILFHLGLGTIIHVLVYRAKNLIERFPMNHAHVVLRKEAGRDQPKPSINVMPHGRPLVTYVITCPHRQRGNACL